MITHYYIYFGDHVTGLKNQLEKEAKAYLESLEGKLIESKDYDQVKKLIIDKLQQINESNKRCKPLMCTFSESHKSKYIYLSGFYAVTFRIYAAELNHLNITYSSLSNN